MIPGKHFAPLPLQRGMATLAVALVLLVAATIMTFSVARTGLLEQRIATTELRAMEAQHRAEALLDYAISWAASNRIPGGSWSADPSTTGFSIAAFSGSYPAMAAAYSGEAFNHQLRFRRNDAEADFVEVIATATSASGISSEVRQYVRPTWVTDADAPPVVMDGCIQGTTASPQAFPAGAGSTAIATTQAYSPSCLASSGFDLNGGSYGYAHAGAGNLWDSLFNASKDRVKMLSALEAAAVMAGDLAANDRTYYWVYDGAGGDWAIHNGITSLPAIGSSTHPVVIVFDKLADCPTLTAGADIYGIVYYETPASGECDASGWSGANLYGTLFVEGNLTGLAGDLFLYDFSYTTGTSMMSQMAPVDAPRIPGTWRDF